MSTPQLPTCTAHDLYFTFGPIPERIKPGFPLPDGTLPIAIPDLTGTPRIHGIDPTTWQSFLDLVAHTRSSNPQPT